MKPSTCGRNNGEKGYLQGKWYYMNYRHTSILYLLLGLYSIMVSWYYNHSILLVIIHYIFWPIYLLYELLTGHLSHDMWKTIPESYFK
jgi:hypothetical protein